MNILRALGLGAKSTPSKAGSLRSKLPEVCAFVDVAIGNSRSRVSVAVDAVERDELVTQVLAGIAPGMAADFLYTNPVGKFRFATVCTKVDAKSAYFELPPAIKTIESFGDRRTEPRVPWIIPVQWRYAPNGQGYGEFLNASMMDLSRGGASLVVGRELKPGTQVEVRFMLKSKSEPLTELGQVVRAAKIETSDKNAAGIQFLEVDPSDERVLTEFVVERTKLRRNRGIV